MACKGTHVSKREVRRMYDLYQDLGSYKAVGKKMHRDAGTVSKHIAIYESALNTANVLSETKKESSF